MIKKILLACLILSSFAFSMQKDEIKTQMSNKIDTVLTILKDTNLKHDQKVEKIVPIFDHLFDYELMARLSLGNTWKVINDSQKEEFVKLFTENIKLSYVDKLTLYSDEQVKILGTEEPKSNRVVLKTQLIGKKEKYDINYKFYQKGSDSWLIYDVNLLGVSIIQTFRQQYSGFLKDKTFEDLVQYLSDKKSNETK